ncbi:MAG: CaiB/BaiF CoA transferase family protein [Gemmatimonadaceae bacterium]
MKPKVLDLTRVLAGPLCSMMLGDLGGDVIKVERPPKGDETRGWGPPFAANGESAYFVSVNRNKKSIGLELSDPRDRAVLLQLMTGADVVIENFLPGALGRVGLDPPLLLRDHPSLIWCTLSGFDQAQERPGYDFVVQAESGWMSITGERDGSPMKVGVALVDVIAGKDAAIAILAALAERAAGVLEVGQRLINIALDSSAKAALVNVAQNVLVAGVDAARWGNAHPNLVPYQLFEALDRPFVIAVGSDRQWRACAEALNLGAMVADQTLASNEGRVHQRERVVDAITRRVRDESADYWIQKLGLVGVPCGLVKSVAEALEGTGASALTGISPSIPGVVRYPPPRFDEHGAAIRSLGWRAFQP